MDADEFKQILELQKSMFDKLCRIQEPADPLQFPAQGVSANDTFPA